MTRTAPATAAPIDAQSEIRRRLLEAMAEAVRERGYRDVTVADVVRCARTSRRTFYAHFADKQDCFTALLAERTRAMIGQIEAAIPPARRGSGNSGRPPKPGSGPRRPIPRSRSRGSAILRPSVTAPVA